MALQGSGPISLADIAAEFGGTAPHSINEYYRGGGLVPNVAANNNVPTSGAISLGNFYNAVRLFAFSFAGGSNLNLRTLAVAAGWDQSAPVQGTNTGTATGNAGLTINGSFPGGVTFINNGTVNSTQGSTGSQGTHGAAGVGAGGGTGSASRGGAGGAGGAAGNGASGGSGGTALVVSVATTIVNNGSLIGGLGGTGGPPGVQSGGGGGGGGGGVQQTSGADRQRTGGRGGNGFGQNTGGPFAGLFGGPPAGNGGAGGASGSPGSPGGGGLGSPGGAGGQGGAAGVAGSTGVTGAQGLYISGFGNVTWGAFGTRTGGQA